MRQLALSLALLAIPLASAVTYTSNRFAVIARQPNLWSVPGVSLYLPGAPPLRQGFRELSTSLTTPAWQTSFNVWSYATIAHTDVVFAANSDIAATTLGPTGTWVFFERVNGNATQLVAWKYASNRSPAWQQDTGFVVSSGEFTAGTRLCATTGKSGNVVQVSVFYQRTVLVDGIPNYEIYERAWDGTTWLDPLFISIVDGGTSIGCYAEPNTRPNPAPGSFLVHVFFTHSSGGAPAEFAYRTDTLDFTAVNINPVPPGLGVGGGLAVSYFTAYEGANKEVRLAWSSANPNPITGGSTGATFNTGVVNILARTNSSSFQPLAEGPYEWTPSSSAIGTCGISGGGCANVASAGLVDPYNYPWNHVFWLNTADSALWFGTTTNRYPYAPRHDGWWARRIEVA